MVRIPGGHVPNIKNRSSKNLIPLTKCKSVFRSMSNAALAEYNTKAAQAEKARRKRKHDKKNPPAA